MTDQEFFTELRRGLIIIVRAVCKRYRLSWRELMPHEEPAATIETPPAPYTMTVTAVRLYPVDNPQNGDTLTV